MGLIAASANFPVNESGVHACRGRNIGLICRHENNQAQPVAGPATPTEAVRAPGRVPRRRGGAPATGAAGRVVSSGRNRVTLMPAAESRNLIEALAQSKVYQEYERAFAEATGLLVSLRPVESWRLAHHGKRHESPFCGIMSEKSRSCAACLQVQERLAELAVNGVHTTTCFAGLSDTAVPVRLGDQVVGFLQTGQVFRKPPTRPQFNRAVKVLERWGLALDRNRLQRAYFNTRVVSPRRTIGCQIVVHLRATSFDDQQPGAGAT